MLLTLLVPPNTDPLEK